MDCQLMKRLLVLWLALLPMLATAQLMACRGVVKDSYDFWLYLPDGYGVYNPKPVVMFLHGRSLSGNNLAMVRHYGCINALERGLGIDAIVVAPQTQHAWDPAKVNNLYEWVKGHYAVDANRFYVVGMSMGGFGTLDYVATYPDKVAAAMAMCGGATITDLCGLTEVPLWIIHGMADKAVPVGRSEKVVEAMAACGDTSRLIFNKLPKVNHTRLARVFYLEQTYQWLFSHTLTDSARLVNKGFTMSDGILADAYNNLANVNKLVVKDFDSSSYNYDGKKYYIVKKGDSLSQIAVENNTTVTFLCKLNRMKKTDKLRVGKKLRVR